LKAKLLKDIEKGVAVAINQSAFVNRPETFQKLRHSLPIMDDRVFFH
jgi:hypothetical protein